MRRYKQIEGINFEEKKTKKQYKNWESRKDISVRSTYDNQGTVVI